MQGVKDINYTLIHLFAFFVFALLSACTPQEEQKAIKVESVEIDQSDMTLEVGASATLTAIILPEVAEDKTIKWSSSDESKVLVASSGKAVAIAVGQAVVTAQAGEAQDLITITVVAKTIAVTGISIKPTELTIKVGETGTLISEITPPDATNNKVTWMSSNDEVATVEGGTVTGIKPGNVTITAITDEGAHKAECIVTIKSNLAPSVTVGAENISAVSAILKGKANLESTASSDLKVGFQYSKSAGILPSNSTTVEASDADSDYNYSVDITGLEPDTKYYFRSFVRQNGQDTYGETKEFTTKDISSLIHTQDASAVSAVSAKLNASLDLTDVQYQGKSHGFYWGTTAESITSKVTSTESEGALSALLSSLTPSKQYYYQAYITLDGKELRSDVRSFTTKNVASLIHTQDASAVSAVSAKLNASLDLTDVQYQGKSHGFYWGTTAESITSKVTSTESEGALSALLSSLTPSKQYYYQAYITLDSKELKDDVRSFTTKDLATILETKDASDILATGATLNAKLDLTDVIYSGKSYGFYWGISEISQNTRLNVNEIKDGAFSASLTNLSHKTQYWYKTYVEIDSQTFYGKVKSFTTNVIPVQSVSIDKTEYTFHTIGTTLNLKATVLPADATDKSVEWSSDEESVATVDQNGTVKAIGNGTATITVTTKDLGKTANCTITVAQWATSISFDTSSITLNEGQEQNLTATFNPDNAADKTLKWTSSDENVAKVDETGKVTAISKGTATIKATATDGSGKYASCFVTVKRLVSSIQLNKTSLTLYGGETETIIATVTPSDASNTRIDWTSSNRKVAVVSDGVIDGMAIGTTIITASAKDGSGVSATCEVEVKQPITSITLSKASLSLIIGGEETLSYSILPDNADDKTLIWSSSDYSIADIDQTGRITAKAKGKATIQVTALHGSGVTASCNIVVSSPCPSGAVDLGTTTSDGYNLYWAVCNLGAEKPEDCGDYYAWGETETKTDYDWSTYKFGTSSYGPVSKYNTKSSYGSVDNKIVLDPDDDVAHVKLGDNWRMPTYEECTELKMKCTMTGVTNYNGSGISGTLVTATNGNSIFLPGSGYYWGDNGLQGSSYSYCWSSSLREGSPGYAWLMHFVYSAVLVENGFFRCQGLTVRPVTE